MNTANSTTLKASRCRQSDGKLREIRMSHDIWQILDWLIEEYNYPVNELIDDTIEYIEDGEDFDAEFAKGVTIAYEAQVMARDGLVNDNFSK